MNFRQRLRGARHDDRGISLAELLVTIMIFGIVLTVVTSTFISLTRATSQAGTTDSNVRVAANGMNEMTRIIRGAVNNPVPGAASDSPAFSEATPESMTLTTAVNQTGSITQPVQVRLYLGTDRSLIEKKTASVAYQTSFWQFTGAASQRTLTGAVSASSASVPVLFQYFDQSGAPLVPQSNGALSPAQMSAISTVTVSITIAGGKATDPGVRLVNTVGLPNINTSGQVS